MYYSIFYRDDDLMDSDGCDGSGCSHSDCSNYNLLLSHTIQETRYMFMHVIAIYARCTCLCYGLQSHSVASSEQKQTVPIQHQYSHREMTQEEDYEVTYIGLNESFLMKDNIAYSTVKITDNV